MTNGWAFRIRHPLGTQCTNDMGDYRIIEILTTQEVVAGTGANLHHAIEELQNGHIEGCLLYTSRCV